VDFQSDRGLTSLMRIIKSSGSACMVEMVRTLLDAGADPNIQDASGNTALHHAVQWKQSEVIPLLIEGGAVLDVENKFGLTALDIATNLGDEEIIKTLREAGAKE
jgi:ankyrin repeat protein